MEPLLLRDWHESRGAAFVEVNRQQVARDYGDPQGEHNALRTRVVLMDLSHRGRVCLIGEDRARFLNGQVTNNIANLRPGQGCYAALLTAKGKMESDVHVHCLADELLLDFEPGLTNRVVARLEKYIVADQVEVVDLSGAYGLLSLQGPEAAGVVGRLGLADRLPEGDHDGVVIVDEAAGEMVLACHSRFGTGGFDLFVPQTALEQVATRLQTAVTENGGCLGGWEAAEIARVEAGLPRYGQDMDETFLPLEANVESRAIRYDKGCYVGQEVINRIHTIGRVNRSMCGFLLPNDLPTLPGKGAEFAHNGVAAGFLTSVIYSPVLGRTVALGYVRREMSEQTTTFTLVMENAEIPVEQVELPFVPAHGP